MECAKETSISLATWSPPCRMCGQLLLLIPDRPRPHTMTTDGTICFECYPEWSLQQLAKQKRWDAQYNALLIAQAGGLPKATIARITDILMASSP